MLELTIADKVEVLVLVDNATDNLSSAPAFVETELSRFWRRGGRLTAGNALCCAAHGLSCAITVWRNGASKTLLFDTGPDASVFERNVDRLGFDTEVWMACFCRMGIGTMRVPCCGRWT